jgi:hypothetical protein
MRFPTSVVFLSLVLLLLAQPAFAAPAAGEVFAQRWQHYDQAVAARQAERSWTWGPYPYSEVMSERYYVAESNEWRERTVQYFDKGRMEINNPEGDPSALWYVTSGRLPVDLMLAPTQVDFNEGWKDAYITAIGDYGSFPTYLDLQPLYEVPGRPRSERLNQPAIDMLEPDLSISRFADYADDPATILREGGNNHLVPQAFRDFMNQRGLVWRDGRFVRQQVYDPLYIFGLPVTPAVWVQAQVGGERTPVLFQVFERRVLTYNPANPPDFRVEMGNVGAHYRVWQTNPIAAREFNYTPADGSRLVAPADPNVVYTLEVEVTKIPLLPDGPPIAPDSAVYRIYRSNDGGQSRELRYTGEIGPGCRDSLSVELLPPRDADYSADRIGLKTVCAMNPSASRGSGARIYSSYDGAESFFFRGGS